MPLLGTFELDVAEVEAASLTLRTRGHHPEAGRVTVSAEADAAQHVRVTVRTRTRANGWRNRLMAVAGGQLLQARLWASFLEHVSLSAASPMVDGVHARTARVDDEPADTRLLPIAVGRLHGVQ